MAKNKNLKKENAKKEPLIVTKDRPDGTKDIIITKSPAKTVSGRIIVGILLFVMVVLPLIVLLVSIFKAL